MKKIIKRTEIISYLNRWKSGVINSEEIYNWANETFRSEDYDCEDWEAEDISVTNEVLSRLDRMDMDFITEEDIPAFIDFLLTPFGAFEHGLELLEAYLNRININEREEKLKNKMPYKMFIQSLR